MSDWAWHEAGMRANTIKPPEAFTLPHQTAAQNVFVVCRLDITMGSVICSLQYAVCLRMAACH